MYMKDRRPISSFRQREEGVWREYRGCRGVTIVSV